MTEMRWPWVSRHRLDEAERRLDEANKERRELLDRLLDGAPDRRRLEEQVRRVEGPTLVEAEPVEPPSTPEVQQFDTPFDRINRRFDQAGAKARDPRFKARA